MQGLKLRESKWFLIFTKKAKIPHSTGGFSFLNKSYHSLRLHLCSWYANVAMCMYLCICVLYIQTFFSRKRIMQGSLNLMSCLFCIHEKTKNKLRSNSSLLDWKPRNATGEALCSQTLCRDYNTNNLKIKTHSVNLFWSQIFIWKT